MAIASSALHRRVSTGRGGFLLPNDLCCMENCDLFATHFEGAHFDQVKDREKGRINGAWLRTDEWKPIERCGPLELPRFFREYGR